MTSAGPLLQLREISKQYATPGGAGALRILDRVSLDITKGESLAIVGPSGSGKSTLLHIMGTLDRPTTGSVLLESQDLGQMNDLELAAVRNRNLGFVFQAHYLLPQCSVMENVLVPTLARRNGRSGEEGRNPKAEIRKPRSEGRNPEAEGRDTREKVEERAMRLLKRVGLKERLDHRPGELSGGERQRVAVVRALINEPQLLLADEPTGSLDQASADELGRLLLELNHEEGVALVVVTHARDLAHRLGRILELKAGRLQAPQPQSPAKA